MSWLLAHFSRREVLIDLIFAALVLLVCFLPKLGASFFEPVERAFARLAARRGSAILLITLAAILVRVSLLRLVPVPVPAIQDEFSYLLAADTFAHGRLTNPPHPMCVFFETFHVNQQPTYMSKYPPGQGAVLALGQVLGHPWIGVLLSVAGMCAAALWMLQGWLPARWALLGAMLLFLRLAIFGYWISSYWGGAVAAIGGALVAGALLRIVRFQRWRDSVFLALGVAILANTRPLEGAIFCAPVAVFLLVWLCTKRGPSWRVAMPRIILPIGVIALLCCAFMAYYNWRGTGNTLAFPYQVNEHTYSSTPTLFWQKARPPLHYHNPQFEDYYNRWARNYWVSNRMDSLGHASKHISLVLLKIGYFFFWPELCLAFLALPWLWGDRRIRILLLQALLCFLGFLAVPWTEAHYAAPEVPVLFLLVVQGIRHLRTCTLFGRPVGMALSRIMVLSAVLFVPLHHRAGTFEPENGGRPKLDERARWLSKLKALPGEHLVIVRYAPVPTSGGEWVYNDADIDHAKVVWAREIPGIDSGPLLNYFGGRHVWLAEPDPTPPRLSPYPGLESLARPQ